MNVPFCMVIQPICTVVLKETKKHNSEVNVKVMLDISNLFANLIVPRLLRVSYMKILNTYICISFFTENGKTK